MVLLISSLLVIGLGIYQASDYLGSAAIPEQTLYQSIITDLLPFVLNSYLIIVGALMLWLWLSKKSFSPWILYLAIGLIFILMIFLFLVHAGDALEAGLPMIILVLPLALAVSILTLAALLKPKNISGSKAARTH